MHFSRIGRKALLTVLIVLILGISAEAQNWSSFRGGVAQGGTGRGTTPATWDVANAVNVAWKTQIPGIALSSPITWEDRIYLTTAVPLATPQGQNYRTPHEWKLMSFSRTTGKMLWETKSHEGVPHMDRHPVSSYANSTPATDGRYVVALFGTDALACFDKNGKMLWKNVIPQEKNDPRGGHFGTSPVIFEDLAILQNDRDKDSYVAAYKLADGAEVWKVARDENQGQSTPAVVWTEGATRRPLLVIAGGRTLRAIDARTGKDVWNLTTNNQFAASSPTVVGDVIIFGSGGSNKGVYAIRAAASGDITPAAGAAQNQSILWKTERGAPQIPSPLVASGLVYVLGDNGVLTAYNLKDGSQIYQHRAGRGEFYASPVLSGDKMYIVNTDGDVTVVRAGAKFEVLAQNSFNERTSATPAIIDGTMYVRTAGHLIALRESAKR